NRRDADVGTQVVVDDGNRDSLREEWRRHEREIALVERSPVPTVEEHERGGGGARGNEQVERLLGSGAVAQIELRRKIRPGGGRRLRVVLEPPRMVRHGRAKVVASLDEIRREDGPGHGDDQPTGGATTTVSVPRPSMAPSRRSPTTTGPTPDGVPVNTRSPGISS